MPVTRVPLRSSMTCEGAVIREVPWSCRMRHFLSKKRKSNKSTKRKWRNTPNRIATNSDLELQIAVFRYEIGAVQLGFSVFRREQSEAMGSVHRRRRIGYVQFFIDVGDVCVHGAIANV